jgi:hypothetical protein
MVATIVIAVIVLLVVLLAGILAFAASKPDSFGVRRATSVKAPPEKIIPLIVDFHRWRCWSPYEHRDPQMKRTLSGAASGTGAIYEWDGNNKVGAGRMEILDSSPPSKVTIKLDFIRPFEGHNIAEFILDRTGNVTTLTWAMHGPNRYISKLMGLLLDMDRMIGKDFETGLANLKALAEK